MKLQVIVPTQTLIEDDATRVMAQGLDGAFTLAPRHIDCVSALAAGLLAWLTPEGKERFVAVDGGLLLKQGDQVRIVTPRAVPGADLGALRQMIDEEFRIMDEHERQSRTAASRLETHLVRRFMELREYAIR